MLKCTYIVLLNNNENNIFQLVKSLKELNSSFRKEFIIINDGSKDNSLKLIKSATSDLPRTTIITQKNQGSTISMNEAINLATGNYIQFVEGNEILHPESTTIMIDSCLKFGTEVACAKIQELENEKLSNNFKEKLSIEQKLIQSPIQEIFLNRIPSLRNIGSSGTLVKRTLLEKAGKADSTIYSQTMSLSLRCAKYSNFVFINNTLSFKQNTSFLKEKDFESYNNLRAIYNFAINHPDICKPLIAELLKNLASETSSKKLKLAYYLQSKKAKYSKAPNLNKALEFYKTEYEKLF
ncbi:MAG: glycosyltransferase family 2 protein [Rickettsiaceae bacterium]